MASSTNYCGLVGTVVMAECACTSCSENINGCLMWGQGCTDVFECFHNKRCDPTNCTLASACEAEINQYGGTSASGVKAALGLLNCVYAGACELRCDP
jgi:hypothetical protein